MRSDRMVQGSYVDLTKFEHQEKHILENLSSLALDAIVEGDGISDSKCKTKIICTLGPVSRDVAKVEEMLRAGMNIARFNFSHGTHEYHQETLNNVRQAVANTGIKCGILLDTKGPEIRTGMLDHGGPVMLEKDSEITLTTDYNFKGNEKTIAVSYPSLAKDVKPGSQILCADGSITLTVLSCDVKAGTVKVRCENSAKLGERKNMNLPGVVVDLPTITEKDKKDLIDWGVKNKVDYIAASFVRKGSDVDFIRKTLGEAGKHIQIISKVENMEGLDNFNDIVAASDGVMVARGDLGMEIRMEQIFLAQKRMIKRCNDAGKFVVTATQMLESMTGAPRPTRAEATDVANSILDGTDCIMLSGETAAGSYPIEAIKVMSEIAHEAEAYVDNKLVFQSIFNHQSLPMSTNESVASSAIRSAQKVGASLVVCLAESGNTAKLLAKYRPACPILCLCIPIRQEKIKEKGQHAHDPEAVARRLLSSRGVYPFVSLEAQDSPKAYMDFAIALAKRIGMCKTGDRVVGVHDVDDSAVMKIVDVE